MTGLLRWNHWFWITSYLLQAAHSSSLLLQQIEAEAPFQRFAMADLKGEAGQGETDDAVEPFIASDIGGNVVVSKSVSVSRVTVEKGGVRVAKKIDLDKVEDVGENGLNEDFEVKGQDGSEQQSSINDLISLLQPLAKISYGQENAYDTQHNRINLSNNSDNDDEGQEYQLVYWDGDFNDGKNVDDDYDYVQYNYDYSEDLYHDVQKLGEYDQSDPSEEDLYLYDLYDDYNEHLDDHYNYIDYYGNFQNDVNSDDNAENVIIIAANEESKNNKDDTEQPANDSNNNSNDSFDNLDELVSHFSSTTNVRSDQARGRSLELLGQDESELYHEKVFQKVEVPTTEHGSTTIAFIEKQEISVNGRNADETYDDNDPKLLIVSKPTEDMNLKIGIFGGVVVAVLMLTGLLVVLARHRARRKKLLHLEEKTVPSSHKQFVLEKDLEPNMFSSNIVQKSSHVQQYYSNDDLHSLDDDSFLSSLETCTNSRERFGWDL